MFIPTRFQRSKRVIGHVDRIDADAIAGWAIGPGADLQLTLNIEGRPRNIEVERAERPDVAAIYGLEALWSGFNIKLRDLLSHDPRERVETLSRIEVRANGQLLKPSANAIMPRFAREVLGLRYKATHVTAELTAWRAFVLEGSVNAVASTPPSIVVEINGALVDCPTILVPTSDASTGNASRRFQIEIPGHVWLDVPQDRPCVVKIKVAGVVISKGLEPITRVQASNWVNALFAADSTTSSEYDRLLALEHVRYGGLGPLLEPQARAAIDEFCRTRNLESFVDLPIADGHAGAVWSSTKDLNAHVLRIAIKDFNEALGERPGSVFELYKQIKLRHALDGARAEALLVQVAPLLCDHGEFDRVHELKEVTCFEPLISGPEIWKLTTALPYLVSVGRIATAAELLWRITKDKSDWRDTECIHYALRKIHEQCVAGEVQQKDVETLLYAFIALLDSFEGEWFSRLHDLNLVKGMIHALSCANLLPHWVAYDIARAAVRHYGMNPLFWRRLPTEFHLETSTMAGRLLSRAARGFDVLELTLERGLPSSPTQIEQLRSALSFFHKHGNPDAIMFMREIAAMLLSSSDVAQPISPIKNLIDDLLEIDESEIIRLASFPSEGTQRLIENGEDFGPRIFDALRELSCRPKGPLYHVQIEAAEALRDMRAASDDAHLDDAAHRVASLAGALANWNGRFLGCDLLLDAYRLSSSRSAWALRLGEAVRHAIRETDENGVLPAAIVTTLARLAMIAGNDPMLRHLDNELRDRLSVRHGDGLPPVLSAPAAPVIATARGGWPHDTLVVVYSCRKYLPTRIQAIRDTWIQDLKALGIPYVIVVGDGDGALHGDLLELRVSDAYEHLPEKTLAMLDWAYRNTDAQYVLKIDDDCRLDVERYFGSLTYRKFHYYGRLMKRGIGGMDRAWHQRKSLSKRARHALDKSPEPSSYADGAGGYCLSRLAIATLTKNLDTPAGQKLLASSFMEDKLVGDLLALSGIGASDEDYYCNMRRKATPTARAVGVYETFFDQSAITPTMLTHLDEPISADVHANGNDEQSLRPKKIWPACWPVNGSYKSNSLEYLSPKSRLGLLRTNAPVVVAVVRNEITMLPHFLNHYRKLGVEAFLIADNLSSDGSQELLLAQPDVVTYSVDAEYRHSRYGVAWQQALLSNHCTGKWVVVADADEFLVFEDCESRRLSDFVTDLEREGASACYTNMIDMYPLGDMREADFRTTNPFDAAPWFDSPPYFKWRYSTGMFGYNIHLSNALRHRLVPNCAPTDFAAQKIALFRYAPWVRLSEGLHYAGNVELSDTRAYFAHFKYHAGFASKIVEEIRRKQHYNEGAEYRRYSTFLGDGGATFFDAKTSKRYENSSSFAAFRD